jgi:hypothetical protein
MHMNEELPPSQQRQWDSVAELPKPLPDETVISYDPKNRNGQSQYEDLRYIILEHRVKYPNDKLGGELWYYVCEHRPNHDPQGNWIPHVDVEEWLLRGKHPWYVSELPEE